MARRKVVVPPLESDHTPATQRLLKGEGLPINAALAITTGGRVRHVLMWARTANESANGVLSKDTLCNLFRPGTSLLRDATVEDNQPLCGACLKTLEAEVLRAKEAMRGEPVE